MQFSKRTALSAVAMAAVAFTVPALANSGGTPNPGSGNHFPSTTQSFDCYDNLHNHVGTIALNGPDKLWPPNHKLIDESATATNDDSSGNTSLTLMPRDVGDVAGGDGGPTHDPDIFFPSGMTSSGTGKATVNFQLRAERSGKGDGRTYTIDWSAMFSSNGGLTSTTCTSTDNKDNHAPFVVTVPHDMGNNG